VYSVNSSSSSSACARGAIRAHQGWWTLCVYGFKGTTLRYTEVLSLRGSAAMPANLQKSQSVSKGAKLPASKPQPISKHVPSLDKKKGRDSDFAEIDSLFRRVHSAASLPTTPSNVNL
jgi:hypothetical protein